MNFQDKNGEVSTHDLIFVNISFIVNLYVDFFLKIKVSIKLQKSQNINSAKPIFELALMFQLILKPCLSHICLHKRKYKASYY